MKIKLMYIVFIIVIICGLNGCSKAPNYTIEEKKEMVLEHLKEKYGEEFEGVSFASSEILKTYDEFWVYPKNGNKEEDLFIVTGVSSKVSKKYEMHDSYFGILIHDKYYEYVNNLVKTIIDEFYLSVKTKSLMPYADRYNKDTKISEIYKKDETGSLYSYIEIYAKYSSVKDRDIGDLLRRIAEIMKENNLVCLITLKVVHNAKYDYFVNNIGKFKIDDQNIKEYYVFGEGKKEAQYEASIYEEYETKILMINIREEK